MMSLKTLLMPVISQRLLARERLLKLRVKAERQRQANGARHTLHYFHQTDDPYSALLGAALAQILGRYDVDLVPHLVSPPPDNAAPERDKLIAYSRVDAQQLAQHYGLAFTDPQVQPKTSELALAQAVLVKAIAQKRFVPLIKPVSQSLWRISELPDDAPWTQGPQATPQEVAAHLQASDALRQKLGHYLGATLFYAGEWYWGLDRLYHLEQRLQDLGAARPGVQGVLFAPSHDLRQALALPSPPPIEFFFSLRSPYSAIVAKRVFELGRLTGAAVHLRYVLPMVMRGLPVPRSKRRYITEDTAREAFVRGIPFGRLNDPVGRPTERGLALVDFAQQQGKGQAYVLSFLHGVWAEGINAGSSRGLRTIVERAGLSWADARLALKDQAWRGVAERNREDLLALGLWGVPSMQVQDVAVWGQDRLWAIEEKLRAGHPGNQEKTP
jgi:2-hydroxychromene-2-carboxylate isomerase